MIPSCTLCGTQRTTPEAHLEMRPGGRVGAVCADCYHTQGRPPTICDLCLHPPLLSARTGVYQAHHQRVRACEICAERILPYLQACTWPAPKYLRMSAPWDPATRATKCHGLGREKPRGLENV